MTTSKSNITWTITIPCGSIIEMVFGHHMCQPEGEPRPVKRWAVGQRNRLDGSLTLVAAGLWSLRQAGELYGFDFS